MKANITLMILLLFSSVLSNESSAFIRIFATGELHAAIEESSVKNRGGIAGISHFFKENFLTTDLLFDAGGFSAGGLYDFGTSGTVSDSLRTDIICSQISQLNYSAITLGDDDLAWGADNIIKWKEKYSLPLISANVSFSENSDLPSHIYLKDENIFITAVTTSKPLVPQGDDITVAPPVESLRRVLSSIPKDARVILLAHLTPEEIDSVLLQFPQIDIVLRGHRQGSDEPAEMIHNRPVLSFGFEGTQIVSAQLKEKSIVNPQWIPIESKPCEYKLPHSREVFDLVIMSGCPYAYSAIEEFLGFQEKSKTFQWDLWFSGTILGDSIIPGLAAGDLHWELSVLAVKELYPERFHDFLWLLVQEEYTLERCFDEMNLSLPEISKWIETSGEDLLLLHYRRADRLAVAASPTLFINNRLYDGKVDSNRFLFELCEKQLEKGSICESFGECLTDSDCNFVDGVSRCENDSLLIKKCVKYDDIAFEIIQLLPDDTSYQNDNNFTETTKELFPKAVVKTFRQNTQVAQQILKKFDVKLLPFYLIDTTIINSVNYVTVAEGLEHRMDKFTFREGFMAGSYYLTRNALPGDKKLFVDIESNLYPILSSDNWKIYPAFSKEKLLNDSSYVTSLLKKGEITQTPNEYYMKYLEGIVVGAPVYILYNNNKVKEIHSQEEFDKFIHEESK